MPLDQAASWPFTGGTGQERLLGLLRELSPGPLAPQARIMPLDQAAFQNCWIAIIPPQQGVFSLVPRPWGQGKLRVQLPSVLSPARDMLSDTDKPELPFEGAAAATDEDRFPREGKWPLKGGTS